MEELRDTDVYLARPWVSIRARGHENVSATHRTTFELTRDNYLTPRGDCIIGVSADKAAAHLPLWFKESARSPEALVVALICSGGICDAVVGRGDPRMSLTDERRIVFRRSRYVDASTVMIEASKAARDIRRDLVSLLVKGERLEVLLSVVTRKARTVGRD